MRKKGSLTIAILALAVLTLIPVLSACDHTHTPVHMEAYEGSCTEKGNIECWYCGGCGKYFADENCNEELPEKDVFTGELGRMAGHDGRYMFDGWFADAPMP